MKNIKMKKISTTNILTKIFKKTPLKKAKKNTAKTIIKVRIIFSDLEALDARDPNFTFVKTSDLPHTTVLFGSKGIIALGNRMAKTWTTLGQR